MPNEAVLKHRPADFLVRECLVVATTDQPPATQHYLLMRKCGYTTMEAVRLLAEVAKIPTSDVTYGGLKDEDAITEQLVAVPVGAMPETDQRVWSLIRDGDRWIDLCHHGYGQDPLKIGRLEGNGFRIVIRNLAEPDAERLTQSRKLNHLFLNYYDTQRFGVPGGPKRTHLVGRNMINELWEVALRELAELRAPESDAAQSWQGSPKAFFDQLDGRTASFYLAAHASDAWNTALSQLVRDTHPSSHLPAEVDGLPFVYLPSCGHAVEVLAKGPELPYTRATFDPQSLSTTTSMRASVIQTQLAFSSPEPDDCFRGNYRVEVSFFLPSGCYATAAIRQMLIGMGINAANGVRLRPTDASMPDGRKTADQPGGARPPVMENERV